MRETLCVAVSEHRVVHFFYGLTEDRRAVELYACGTSSSGEEMLLGWQRFGPSSSGETAGWKHFRIGELRDLKVSEVRFEPRPDYRPERLQLKELWCQV